MQSYPLAPRVEKQFRARVREHGLEELWPWLRDRALPSYTIDLIKGDAGERPGASRLGGLPDLPAGWEWPRCEGGLLTFIGQVNWADVPRVPGPQPERGVLYFFLGVDEPASNIKHTVLYADGRRRKLVRPDPPDEDQFANEECTLFKGAGLRFFPTVSLPDSFADPVFHPFDDALSELKESLIGPVEGGDYSRLLGHPFSVSGDPRLEAYVCARGRPELIYRSHNKPEDVDREIEEARAAGEEEQLEWLRRLKKSVAWFQRSRARHERQIENWQTLLEVGSHRELGMSWWDAGCLQFLIDTRDLAGRNFAHTYCRVQTS